MTQVSEGNNTKKKICEKAFKIKNLNIILKNDRKTMDLSCVTCLKYLYIVEWLNTAN